MENRSLQSEIILLLGSVVLGVCWTEVIGNFLKASSPDVAEYLILAAVFFYAIRFLHSYIVVESFNKKTPFLPNGSISQGADFISKILIMVLLSVISYYLSSIKTVPSDLKKLYFCFFLMILLGVCWEINIIRSNKTQPMPAFVIRIEIWLVLDLLSAAWLVAAFCSLNTSKPLIQESAFGTLILVGILDYILNRDVFFE